MVVSVRSDGARKMDIGPLVIPTGAALGAEVRGVDLKELDEIQFAALKRAWHDREVVLVRGQTLSDQDLIAFSRRFGDLDWAPIQETGRRFVEGCPRSTSSPTSIENGAAIGSLGAGEAVWHTDMSYLDVPPMASMLYRDRSAACRRQHLFCSMYAVYDALPDELKRRIATCGSSTTAPTTAAAICARASPPPTIRAPRPAPCIRWSAPIPTTGRHMLYLGRRRNAYIMGLELADSEALLDEFWVLRRARRNSPGSISGGSAISCCGTTAAPCIGATPSILAPPHHASHADQGQRGAGLSADSHRRDRLHFDQKLLLHQPVDDQ